MESFAISVGGTVTGIGIAIALYFLVRWFILWMSDAL